MSRSAERNVKVSPGIWSKWKDEPCASGCLVKSKGAVVSERQCDDSTGPCEGSNRKVALCDDSALCKGKTRSSPAEYAGQQCVKFSPIVPAIDPAAAGIQAAYSPSKTSEEIIAPQFFIISSAFRTERPWQSCAIYCQRKDGQGFYTPRMELNNLLQLQAHFPDGTWCGNDGQQDLYCLQRSCTAPGVRFVIRRAHSQRPPA